MRVICRSHKFSAATALEKIAQTTAIRQSGVQTPLAIWFTKIMISLCQQNSNTSKKIYSSELPPEYHLIINVFMKSNADIVVEHQEKWDHKIHLEKSKKTLFLRNYKPLLDQKNHHNKEVY